MNTVVRQQEAEGELRRNLLPGEQVTVGSMVTNRSDTLERRSPRRGFSRVGRTWLAEFAWSFAGQLRRSRVSRFRRRPRGQMIAVPLPGPG